MFDKSSHSNVDGFVVRRRANQSGRRLGVDGLSVPDQFLHQPNQPAAQQHASSAQPFVSSRPHKNNLDEVLQQLPGNLHGDEPHQDKKRKLRISRRAVKRTIIVLALVLLVVGGYLGVKFLINSGRVFNGNIFSALVNSGKPLKTDEYGRANILLFGTSEDDEDHEGADLADSIMIASINPQTKEGFLMSIPRDLWVSYGESCSTGYEGKINATYLCGKEGGDEKSGARLLQSVVEKNFGLDVQYYAHVNYTALREAVNAVGGITVNIESDDPRGILDRNFDWRCNYDCHYVKWPNGPANMNGEQALALARARNAAGGYGLSGGNFDREENQQKIILALREKATSAGVLANPVAVSGLLDSLGNNVRTNFEAGEIKTLVDVAQKVDNTKLKRLSLIDEKDPLMTTGNVEGQSIVRPVAGVYDFSDIQSYLKKQLSGAVMTEEEATVDVFNGSGVPGAAKVRADKLKAEGYTVGVVGNAARGDYGTFKIYDLSGGTKPNTKTKLEKSLGVSAQNGDSLPTNVSSTADFVIIIGSNGAN
ncbi:hypothetical protein CYG49_04365 [Candidatus Saccharibacteria bacterium]|nr:MAG: hypothetical protein CYG49_04365 [Candidatus Saccharibacteria bacterium]